MCIGISKFLTRVAAILSVAAFSAAFLLPAAPASACSCAMPKPPEEALRDATAVFSGRAVRIERPVFSPSSLDPVSVAIGVDRWWKGPGTARVTVKTAREGASCGYGFIEGREYLVYAYGDGNDLGVSACSRTKPLVSAGEDIAALGRGTPPLLPAGNTSVSDSPLKSPWAPGAAVAFSIGVLLAGAALGWFFRGRRA